MVADAARCPFDLGQQYLPSQRLEIDAFVLLRGISELAVAAEIAAPQTATPYSCKRVSNWDFASETVMGDNKRRIIHIPITAVIVLLS